MHAIFNVVGPVFVLIALGYAAARWKLVAPQGFSGLNTFAFALATPALLFAGGTSGQGGASSVALAFFIGCFIVYALSLGFGLFVLKLPVPDAGLFSLNGCFGNTSMLGIPLIFAAFGQEGLALLLAIIAFHALLILPMATVVAELGIQGRVQPLKLVRNIAGSLVRNPIVVAVALAAVWRVFGLPVPAFARHSLEMLGAAVPGVALFCLGGSLLMFDLRGAIAEACSAAVLKLALMPALVFGTAEMMGLAPLETAVAVMTAGLPTGANAFLLARRYNVGEERSGATVLLTTAVSIITLSAMYVHFHRVVSL